MRRVPLRRIVLTAAVGALAAVAAGCGREGELADSGTTTQTTPTKTSTRTTPKVTRGDMDPPSRRHGTAAG